jgi:hypothetical protein
MESESVTNLRRGFEAFMAGDLETVENLVDPSLEIEDRILPEGSPDERGVAALVANSAQVREVFGEASWEPQEIVDLGDRILVKLDVYRTWSEARAAVGLED